MKNLILKSMSFIAITMIAASTSFAGEVPEGMLENPPTEHFGLTITGKHSLELGKQIPALKGYQYRVRTVTIKPGGVVKNHGHTTRPGAFYVVKGKITEVRNKKKSIIKSGQVVLEDYGTDHWVINDNKEEAVLFVFDIVPVK